MKPLLLRFRQLYKRFFAAVDQLQSPFLLAVRLYWGWQLIQSGWGKLHNLPKVTDFFADPFMVRLTRAESTRCNKAAQ